MSLFAGVAGGRLSAFVIAAVLCTEADVEPG
jgi:hypothetical protein